MGIERQLYEQSKKLDKILKSLCCIQQNGGVTPEGCCVNFTTGEGVVIGIGSGFFLGETLIAPIEATGSFQVCNAALTDPAIEIRIITDDNLTFNGAEYNPIEGGISIPGTDFGFETWCGQTINIELAPPPGFGFSIGYAGNSSGLILSPEIESISNGGTLNGNETANLAPGTDSATITFRLPAYDSRGVRQLYFMPNPNMTLLSSVEDGADLVITAVVRPEYDGEGFYIGDTVQVNNNTVDEIVVGFNTDLDITALSVDVDTATARLLGNGYANAHVIIQFVDTPTANYDVTFSKAGVPKYSVLNQSAQQININSLSIPGADKSFDELTIVPTP